MDSKSNELGFFEACERGDIATAKVLLKLVDPSILSRTWEGRTCFHVAVIAEDPDFLQELSAKLPRSDLINIIRKTDKKGDTALHLAVRKYSRDLVKQLVGLGADLCADLLADLYDSINKEGETPLHLALSSGFSSNGLHILVEHNQVKLVQFLIENNVDLSKFINQPYQPTQHGQQSEEGDQRPKEERNLTKASSDEGDKPSQWAGRKKNKAEEKITTKLTDEDRGNEDTNTQNEKPIVQLGDTPLHIAARNKFEHMVNLLLKVPKVNKLAWNSEHKTPFEIAREVVEYHESFSIIKKLAYYGCSPRPFMYCAPRPSHKKHMEARRLIKQYYKDRRNADQVLAALLATMTFAAAFSLPGGFQTENKRMGEIGSPILIRFPSFKLFLIFDCIAFFLSLFVCLMCQMIPEHATGDTMLFMTSNSLLVCCSVGFTAFGFMAAVYTILARKVKTFSSVVLGILIAITFRGLLAFFCHLAQFAVTRARFHRLCGVSCFFDDIVEDLWSRAERCGLLAIFRSDEVSRDLITGHVKFSRLRHEEGYNSDSSSPWRAGGNAHV